jgi:hypothetical protein
MQTPEYIVDVSISDVEIDTPLFYQNIYAMPIFTLVSMS